MVLAELNTDQKRKIHHTPGSIFFSSLNKIIHTLSLTSEDIFLDFGSGLGQTVLYIFLMTPVKAAYGLEVIEDFHQMAFRAAEVVKQNLPHYFLSGRNIYFEARDFTKGPPLQDATVALVVSTCFGPMLLSKLSRKINLMPNLHTVITLRPLIELKYLTCKKIFSIECSWDSALCYIYSK